MCTTGNSGVARKNELVIASSFRWSLVLILVSWGLTAKLVCSFSAENNAPSRQTRAQTERNFDANSSTQNRNRDSGNNSKRRGLFPTDDDDYDADEGGNTFKNAPFDDSVAFVDPDFEGCDLVELYNKLSALVNIKKDGYETTLEFEKRKNEFLKEESKKAFLGKITLASRIAAPIRTFQCRYDADASKLRVVLDDYRYVFPNSVGVLETSADDLIGSLLKTRLPHKYGVVAEKEIGREFWIKMDASRARDLQENVRALLVFTIDVRSDRDTGNFVATLQDAFSPTYKVVCGKNAELWLYDARTGEIIFKQPLAKQSRPLFVSGDEQSPEEEREEEDSAPDVFDSLGFDESDDQIDPHYQGIDPRRLYSSLRDFWTPLNKDEFETVEEYKDRRRSFLEEVWERDLYGDCKLDARFAVVLAGRSGAVNQVYDANKRVLVFNLEGPDNSASGARGVCPVLLRKKTVDSPSISLFALNDVINPVANDRELKSSGGLLFFHKCPAEEAQNLRGHVSALVLFSIDDRVYSSFDPYGQGQTTDQRFNSPTLYGKFYRPATYSDFWTKNLYGKIWGKNIEVWFFDDRTGKVIKKSNLSRKRVRNNRRPAQKRVDLAPDDESSTPPPKTWQELLAESVDEPASWEKKKPAIIVPDDCATLAEAIEKAKSGDVVQLKKANNPYPLGVKLGAARKGVVIDKPLAIVGETGEASEVTIEVGVDESIFVETKGAMFKGITFQCGAPGLAKTCEPIVSVGKSGYATFKYCSFVGNGVERSIGVETSGKGVKSAFWKCDFKHFGDSGLLAKDEAVATLRYCEFLDDNHYAFTSEGGASVTLARCHFVDNEICIHAETGGSCEITESRFAGNKRRADISPASRNRVKESENVYDE